MTAVGVVYGVLFKCLWNTIGKGIPYSIRALGQELIPFSRQSARRRCSHKPGGGCHYFPLAHNHHPTFSTVYITFS